MSLLPLALLVDASYDIDKTEIDRCILKINKYSHLEWLWWRNQEIRERKNNTYSELKSLKNIEAHTEPSKLFSNFQFNDVHFPTITSISIPL